MALGDFTANNLVGPGRLTTRSRDVHISDFTNSLQLSVERGDVELRPGKLPLAKMDVHVHFGDIEVSLPPAAKFDLTGITSRGETYTDFGAPLRTEHNGNGGAIRGSNGGPVVNLQTERGKMNVRKAGADDKPFAPDVDGTSTSAEPAKPAVKPLQKVEQ
jgi:hypothetical protein